MGIGSRDIIKIATHTMTGQVILDEYDKLTDDMSELSPEQKLVLANQKYHKVINDRDWEWLRKTQSVAIASGEIVVPTDFRNFAENNHTSYRFGFWIDESFYPIVNMQDRRTFTSFSYYDSGARVIVLAEGLNLDGQTAEFDYFHIPADLTVNTSPVFRDSFHKILPYLMAVEHDLIDKTEKNRAYSQEFADMAQNVLEDMEYEDDQLKENWLSN